MIRKIIKWTVITAMALMALILVPVLILAAIISVAAQFEEAE